MNEQITVNEQKVRSLLDVAHIEELFFVVSILSFEELETYVKHFKDIKNPPTNDKRLQLIIKNSKNSHEFVEAIKEELIKQESDIFDQLKDDLTHIRKKGKDVFVLNMKLFQAPLKLKFFKGTGRKEDFYKVKKILQEVKEELEPLKTQAAQEEKEKEARQKEKDAQEKAAKAAKEAQKEARQSEEKNPLPKETEKRLEESTKKQNDTKQTPPSSPRPV